MSLELLIPFSSGSVFASRVVMAGIRGLGTAHPCPICLAHKSELNVYSNEWDYHDAEEVQDLMHVILCPTSKPNDVAAAEDRLEGMDFCVHLVRSES